MKIYPYSVLMLALLSSVALCAASKPQSTKPETQQTASKQTHAAQQPDGDELFTAHCGRCHAAPMSISQRTTGTVIMHMRTRARLSREDEIKLLKFLAP
jgi:cytochrome c5